MPGDEEAMGQHRPWRLVAIIVLSVAAVAVALVRLAGPIPPAWYPPCPFHALTGLWCPGCGSARVLHDLAHGHLRAVCTHNILIVVLAPFFFVWAAIALWRGLRHSLPPPRVPPGAARILLVVIVGFWVARNLPWFPFTLLAPAP